MKIKHKLLLMISIPIIGLLYFTIDQTREKYNTVYEMNLLEDMSKLAVRSSSLIHELQKERGMSAGLLGSKGKEFREELETQRRQTDEEIKKTEDFLKGFNFTPFGDKIIRTLDNIFTGLDRIESKRKLVNELEIPLEDELQYYTNVIDQSFTIIEYIPKIITNVKLTSTNLEFSNMMTAYLNILRVKENAGLERATLSNTFGRGNFGPGMYEKFILLLVSQNIYTKSFLSFANTNQKAFYNNKIQGQFVDEIKRMRQIALKKELKYKEIDAIVRIDEAPAINALSGLFGGSDLGVDPIYWWDMITAKINLLKEVEDYVSNNLEERSEELKKTAQIIFALFLTITCVLVSLTIFLSYVFTIGITRPLKGLVKAANQISTGSRDIKIEVHSKDEIGDLSAAMKHMLHSINNAEEELNKSRDELELRVKERTASFAKLNEELQIEITGRKKGEEEIRKLSSAVEQSPNSIIITNTHGDIEYVNLMFTQMTGYSFEEVIGKNPSILKSGEMAPEEYEWLWNTIISGKEWRGEFHNKKKNGGLYWELATISPIRDLTGKIIHFLAIKEDITERKKMQDDKNRLEAQLRHAQKMETIGTLAGGIAHDFNNILTPIIGFTEMAMIDIKKCNGSYSYLKNVLKASNRAKELVQQILTFSRQIEKERKPIQIHLVIKEAIKLLRAWVPTTIEIRQNIDSNSGTVLADPTQIHQVVMNLCTNAYQAMREKGGVLEVSLHMSEVNDELDKTPSNLKAGKYAHLIVRDTGPGMDSSTIDRIFEPFFTTKDVGEGTGLGLSTVHGIIINHNGVIDVNSKIGEGTTFHIYLPLVTANAKEEMQTEEAIPIGNEQLLIVDDNEKITNIGKEMLERVGYNVTTKNNSLEALELFRSQMDKFDLVITDQTMPNLTGVQLAKELLSMRPNLPIILMTGYSETVTAKMAKNLGICEYVTKPLSMHNFTKVIRRVLEQEQVKV